MPRLLEHTGTIRQRTTNKQVLDKLRVERERGITVKAQLLSLFWNTHNSDTPAVFTSVITNFTRLIDCLYVLQTKWERLSLELDRHPGMYLIPSPPIDDKHIYINIAVSHIGPRGLHLSFARRVPGGAPAGRRRAGNPSTDRGELFPCVWGGIIGDTGDQ
ncbi:LOW QUALITY PROTEIN: hypothetical protein BC938DRAFT_475153 [Jimgerdemannia flammicorona]|uniref:Uncharacterized protein n=1 Tax=Jimgerdemannia flammicorona TaxID=994334 RepID=A0A433QRZ9_9FUNG|nr:LOW QUALITY PROTEIN: hypothetical protein BC938DRAFT_475153 [Jimgerdemannia flammicorona]